MKGIVFTVLQKMVEERLGIEVWDRIINSSNLKSGGSYTAAATYDDEEAIALVSSLAKETQQDPQVLIRAFGNYMLKTLATKYPVFFKDTTLIKFLINVDQVIHGEVRKLYPGAELPEFRYEHPMSGTLIMLYRSKRRLCSLAEGLIEGAAEHFSQPVKISHPICMHQGADHCRLEITELVRKKEGG